MLNKLEIAFLTSSLLLFPQIASAEEVVQELSVPTETAYTPPLEALEGVGGWAVVDPNTGNVHGVIVCTNDVCGPSGSWGGKMPINYMGCSGCDLRFQTNASQDGNVAGWHGTQTNIDENGNVSQTNDGSVKYNSSDDSFDIANQYTMETGGTVKKKQKIKAGKVDSDSNRIENISTNYTETLETQTVEVLVDETVKSNPVVVEYKEWKRFEYESPEQLMATIDAETEQELTTQDEIQEGFVLIIRELTDRVKNFISSIFGG